MGKDLAAIRRACESSRVSVSDATMAESWGAGRLDREAAVVQASLARTIPMLREVGAARAIVLAGDLAAGATPADHRRRIVENLRLLAPAAEKAGITMLLEALNSLVDHAGYFLDTATEGFEIVREVGHPSVRLLYDIYHMQIMQGNVIETVQRNIGLIGHFHAAGVPGRHELDGGELDYRHILDAIAAAGTGAASAWSTGRRATTRSPCAAPRSTCREGRGVPAMKALDIAPFGLPNVPRGEVWFEDPRDIAALEVDLRGQPAGARVFYWRSKWPHVTEPAADADLRDPARFGWQHTDDWWNGTWQRASTTAERGGRTVRVRFKRLRAEGFRDLGAERDVDFRRALAVRVEPPAGAEVGGIRVFTTSSPVRSTLRIRLDAGRATPTARVGLDGYNCRIAAVHAPPAPRRTAARSPSVGSAGARGASRWTSGTCAAPTATPTIPAS